mmetsp:Transcript_90076/g.165307  ORF Transcript_90076/g.165307 Transcript_90076/m.165307 type:complete len:87 (-) Transcript_90076:210-470(-)
MGIRRKSSDKGRYIGIRSQSCDKVRNIRITSQSSGQNVAGNGAGGQEWRRKDDLPCKAAPRYQVWAGDQSRSIRYVLDEGGSRGEG